MKYNIKRDSYAFSNDSINFFINVGLQVTRRCNLKCVHCCEPAQIPDMPLKDILVIVDKLANGGLKKICITGGEPLLREDLVTILEYVHLKKICITLSTNGLILDEDKLTTIKPYIDNIRFSLHGKKETHDEITGFTGSFDKVVDSIKLATGSGIPVSVVMSVIHKNYAEMLDVARICEDNNVGKLHYFSLIKRGRGNGLYGEEAIPFTKIKSAFDSILITSKKEHWNLELNIVDWSVEGQCIIVFPNGDLVGVPSFEDTDNTKVIGNLLTDAPQSLWTTYPFKENYVQYYKAH